MAHFDANRSQVSESGLATFLTAELKADITSVPGIGPRAKEKLAVGSPDDAPILTTFQLIGKYLEMCDGLLTQDEVCNAFYHYLKAKGVDSHRSGIVRSVAEKVSIMIPQLSVSFGMFDETDDE